jgi:hypothetical protein
VRVSGLGATTRTRLPIGGTELAICLLVALECMVVNALAVARVPTLSLDSLGPLALAYHDKQPNPASVAFVILVLLAGTWLPRVGRAAVLVFVGAAAANFASPAIWNRGVPDYIVLLKFDLIANVSDALMMAACVMIAACMVVPLLRRLLIRIRGEHRVPVS